MRFIATPVMNCDQTTEVSLLIDGELSPPEADRIREHVRTCHACWQTLEDFLLLRQEIKAHRFAPDPAAQRQVLGKILAADQPATPSVPRREWLAGLFGAPRFSPALTTLLVMIAVAVTVGVMRYANPPEGRYEVASQPGGNNAGQSSPAASPEMAEPTTHDKSPEPSKELKAETQVADQVARLNSKGGRSKALSASVRRSANPVSGRSESADGKGTPQELVREAEQKYQAAIVLLNRNVTRSQIDPAALARFDKTLAAIDQAIADTRRAVRATPEDPVAVQYMLSAYAKKVEVLEEMTAARRTP